MKPPLCKLCKSLHWTYEEHRGMETEVPEYVKAMAKGAMGEQELPRPEKASAESGGDSNGITRAQQAKEAPQAVTVTQKTCNVCNKPFDNRGGVCNACRQRAYRERSRG